LDGRIVVAAVCGDGDESLPAPAACGYRFGHEIHIDRRRGAIRKGQCHVAGARAVGHHNDVWRILGHCAAGNRGVRGDGRTHGARPRRLHHGGFGGHASKHRADDGRHDHARARPALGHHLDSTLQRLVRPFHSWPRRGELSSSPAFATHGLPRSLPPDVPPFQEGPPWSLGPRAIAWKVLGFEHLATRRRLRRDLCSSARPHHGGEATPRSGCDRGPRVRETP